MEIAKAVVKRETYPIEHNNFQGKISKNRYNHNQ